MAGWRPKAAGLPSKYNLLPQFKLLYSKLQKLVYMEVHEPEI